MPIDIKRVRVNERIRVPQVDLIDENGKRIGHKPTQEALKAASDKGLDLVEIVPNAAPPLCKILDFSKFRYDQEQRSKQERKKSKAGQLKEIRFRPNISIHDFEFKVNHIREFLTDRYRVKITIIFAGREMQHRDIGYGLFNKIKERVADLGSVTAEPDFDRNRLTAIISSKK